MELNGLIKRYRTILFDIFTFSYPKYRLLFFSLLLFALFIIPVDILERGPPFSPCSLLLGEYCYSTGITRGVASLLKGNMSQAIEYNVLSFFVVIFIVSFILIDAIFIIRNRKCNPSFKKRR